jgi:hypothetical protein
MESVPPQRGDSYLKQLQKLNNLSVGNQQTQLRVLATHESSPPESHKFTEPSLMYPEDVRKSSAVLCIGGTITEISQQT